MELKALSAKDMEQIRIWRNQVPETLRTPYLLTYEMQQQYYCDIICNRESHTRYWGIWIPQDTGKITTEKQICDEFIGYGGIENIQWENRIGEISLLIGPQYRRQGYGMLAVNNILHKAFNQMNLEYVYGECYMCSPAVAFWRKIFTKYVGTKIRELPKRKYWNGKYWDSLYFMFSKWH